MGTDVFDLAEARRRKEQGIDNAAAASECLLGIAREIATDIARARVFVTADDVRRVMLDLGLPGLGPAAGALFKGREWEWTGRFKESRYIVNHGRLLRIWRFAPGAASDQGTNP